MVNLSSAMAGAFVALVDEMTATINALGPNPLRQSGIVGSILSQDVAVDGQLLINPELEVLK